jgi:hypothetical protein
LVGLIALSALEALSAKKLCVIPVDAQKFWENFFPTANLRRRRRTFFFGSEFGSFRFIFIFKKKILKIFKKFKFYFFKLIFAFFSFYLSNQY